MNKKIKEIENDYPSPENPCMCYCHLDYPLECWECKMGRHKPKFNSSNIERDK